MSIRVTCPRCNFDAILPEKTAGHEIVCPTCRKPLLVPGSAAAAVDVNARAVEQLKVEPPLSAPPPVSTIATVKSIPRERPRQNWLRSFLAAASGLVLGIFLFWLYHAHAIGALRRDHSLEIARLNQRANQQQALLEKKELSLRRQVDRWQREANRLIDFMQVRIGSRYIEESFPMNAVRYPDLGGFRPFTFTISNLTELAYDKLELNFQLLGEKEGKWAIVATTSVTIEDFHPGQVQHVRVADLDWKLRDRDAGSHRVTLGETAPAF